MRDLIILFRNFITGNPYVYYGVEDIIIIPITAITEIAVPIAAILLIVWLIRHWGK